MTSKTASKPQQPQNSASGFLFSTALIKMSSSLSYMENFRFSNLFGCCILWITIGKSLGLKSTICILTTSRK